MRLEIQEHGTMLTDYFSGTSGVMLPINIDRKTTKEEVLDMLKDEIDMLWDHIEFTAEYHGFKLKDLEYCIDRELATMEDYVRDEEQRNNFVDPELDFTFDEELEIELPVFIFTIEFLKD